MRVWRCWRKCCRASSKYTREWVHRTARGERLLVLHGDQLDGVVPWPAAGSRAWAMSLHDATVMVSHRVNNLRPARWASLTGRSPSASSLSIGTSVRYIEHFEQLAAPARARAPGLRRRRPCGHIHRAKPAPQSRATLYGQQPADWVESCSALIESERGELQLLRWPQRRAHARLSPAARLVADAA